MSQELSVVNPALVQLPSLGLSPIDDMVSSLTRSVAFVERIQLYTKGAAIDQGKILPGHYGIPRGEEIEDLGASIDVVPLVVRPKALDMRDRDAPVCIYERESPEFRAIEELAQEADSGCMVGLTFLVFERSTGKFYEFFCGNKSMRNEAQKIVAYLARSAADAEALSVKLGRPVEAHPPLTCTLNVKYVTKGKWGWHVPVCVDCSTPITNFPPVDVIRAEMEKFANTKSTTVEKVEAPTTRRAR